MTANQAGPLLAVRDLTVGYRSHSGFRQALRHVSLSIEHGQIYGLVGESGSGKTTLALSIMGYLPPAGQVLGGQIVFDGIDLLGLTREALRRIWGAQITLAPQDPLSSLNPSLRIGEQIGETLRHRLGLSDEAAQARSLELMEMVRIADPERVAANFPHQISGGMQQRVLIAMALSTEPKLLVLDEPTTSLDTTTQAAILDLVRDLMQARKTAALYVTHNLGVVARICQRVAVLYAGELVEDGPTKAVYRRPLFPYTQGLLDSVPRLGETKSEVRLRPIQGRIPGLDRLPAGCIFRPRCPLAVEICAEDPPLYEPTSERRTRCHRWQEIEAGEVDPQQPPPEIAVGRQPPDAETLLALDRVRVHFSRRRSLAQMLVGRPASPVKAIDGVSLAIAQGQTLGLVGESGSGKTTLARAILGLVPRTEGVMRLYGVELPASLNDRSLETLRHLQTVFQNPNEALNPFQTVGTALRFPLQHLLGMSRRQADRQVGKLLDAVQLGQEYAKRYPAQLSGGEKQRVAVARAFASNPDLLVADEPVTSLDVSVQASLLNLLNQLQQANNSSYLVISHNLAVVGYLADTVAVIYLGKLMEFARATDLFDPPYHPYTEALLSAIPLIDPDAEQQQIRLEGDVPSPVNPPSGCPFHTRCPRFLGDICVEQEPPWRTTAAGKRYYCHIPADELAGTQDRVFRFQAEPRS